MKVRSVLPRRLLVVPLIAVLAVALVGTASAGPAQAKAFKWNPKSPCTGVTMSTHITSTAMLKGVLHCKQLQAPISKIPANSVKYPSPAVQRDATRSPSSSTYAVCLKSVIGILVKLCRKQNSKGTWSWAFSSVEGVAATKYNNAVADKVDNVLIQISHSPTKKKQYSFKAVKYCTAGAVGGFASGVLGGPAGMVLGAGGGCLTGSITAYFEDH